MFTCNIVNDLYHINSYNFLDQDKTTRKSAKYVKNKLKSPPQNINLPLPYLYIKSLLYSIQSYLESNFKNHNFTVFFINKDLALFYLIFPIENNFKNHNITFFYALPSLPICRKIAGG